MAQKKKAAPARTRTRASTSKAKTKAKAISKQKSPPQSSRSLYTKRQASWYRNATREQRREHEKFFRNATKDARRIFANFTAKEGYNLNKIRYWPKSRLRELSRYVSMVRKWEAGDGGNQFIVVKPKTAAEKAALIRHTGEVSISKKHPQRAYILPTGMPSRASVRYVTEPARETIVSVKGRGRKRVTAREHIPERLRVEIVRHIKGGVLVNRDYLFREVLGWQPGAESVRWIKRAQRAGLPADPWGQMRAAIAQLAEEVPATIARGAAKGEEAQYRLLTSSGLIGPTVPHHQLARLLERWGGVYKSTFPAVILGVRLMGSEWQARDPENPKNLQAESERRRARYRALSKRQRRAALRHFTEEREKPKARKPTRKPKKKPIPRTKFSGTRKPRMKK